MSFRIEGFDSASEFSAAAAGQIVASLLSPESYVGWGVKGSSWVVRAMKAAIQQGGIAGVADLETQWNLVEAGVQPETDWRRTLGVVATAGAAGAIGSKNGSAKSGHVGITPEGPPQHPASSPDVKVEGSTPVASGPDAPSVTPPTYLAPQRRWTSRHLP